MYPPDYSPMQAGNDIKRDIKMYLTGCFADNQLEPETIALLCKLVDIHINKINTNSNKYL